MKRREFMKSMGICATALTLPTLTLSNVSAQQASPNFLFILVDDMGWTGLSAQMHAAIPESKSDFYRTPNIETLAQQGIRFSSAYAPAPMCTPTRASLLTGKSPAQLHITTPGPASRQPKMQKLIPAQNSNSLSASEITLAEVLKRANYATAHFGKWHLSGGGPGEHGFDAHDGDTANGGPGNFDDPNPKDIFGITARGNTFMEKQVKAGKPFYIQLSHYAVHSPTHTLKQTQAAYENRPPGKVHRDTAYAAMTEDLDTGIGLILDKIGELGVADNTYVIMMSDNGAGGRPRSRENAPLAGGKGTLWEGGIRVPLILRGPGIAPGDFCNVPVIGHDLFVTICELAGLREALPEGVEGGSLTPLFKHLDQGEVDRPRAELVFHNPHYGHGPGSQPHSSILLGDYKLIKFYETNALHLYNLAEDIGETQNLAQRLPEKTAELHRHLNDYLVTVNAQLPVENPNYDPANAKQELLKQRPGGGRKPSKRGKRNSK